jgi:acyl dehydratase
MQSYADFPVGATYRTDGITVTEAHVVGWAGLTGDFFRIHMDEAYSQTTEFGTRIAHGPLVYALAIGQVYQARIFTDLALALLGVDKMRHTAPCFIGTTVYTTATIVESRATSRGDRGMVRARLEAATDDGTPVLECEIAMLAHTPESASALS